MPQKGLCPWLWAVTHVVSTGLLPILLLLGRLWKVQWVYLHNPLSAVPLKQFYMVLMVAGLGCWFHSRKGYFTQWRFCPWPLQIILAILVSWLLCFIFTVTDVFPSNSTDYGYYARTDARKGVLLVAPWFKVPYPCKYRQGPTDEAGKWAKKFCIMKNLLDCSLLRHFF